MDDKDRPKYNPVKEAVARAGEAAKPKPDPNDERVNSLLVAIEEYIEKQRGNRKGISTQKVAARKVMPTGDD